MTDSKSLKSRNKGLLVSPNAERIVNISYNFDEGVFG